NCALLTPSYSLYLFSSLTRRPTSATLFPYTTSSDLVGRTSWAGRSTARNSSSSSCTRRHSQRCSSCAAARTSSPATTLHSRRSRSEEHTSELQSLRHLVCRLLLEKKNARSDRRVLTV